jgi:ADP-heptose:LPS heptosyltransferase
MHTLERQAEQLKDAGIWPDAPTAPGSAPPPDLSWMGKEGVAEAFGLGSRYVLLVPGGSPHRPEKRWPAAQYGELARLLTDQGLDVGVIGGAAEAKAAGVILAAAPDVRDLTGRTDYAQIAALGARAAFAIGNDTARPT